MERKGLGGGRGNHRPINCPHNIQFPKITHVRDQIFECMGGCVCVCVSVFMYLSLHRIMFPRFFENNFQYFFNNLYNSLEDTFNFRQIFKGFQGIFFFRETFWWRGSADRRRFWRKYPSKLLWQRLLKDRMKKEWSRRLKRVLDSLDSFEDEFLGVEILSPTRRRVKDAVDGPPDCWRLDARCKSHPASPTPARPGMLLCDLLLLLFIPWPSREQRIDIIV